MLSVWGDDHKTAQIHKQVKHKRHTSETEREVSGCHTRLAPVVDGLSCGGAVAEGLVTKQVVTLQVLAQLLQEAQHEGGAASRRQLGVAGPGVGPHWDTKAEIAADTLDTNISPAFRLKLV